MTRGCPQLNDPSQPNEEGITALHNAICGANHAIVDFLIACGADVNAPDSHGWWGARGGHGGGTGGEGGGIGGAPGGMGGAWGATRVLGTPGGYWDPPQRVLGPPQGCWGPPEDTGNTPQGC